MTDDKPDTTTLSGAAFQRHAGTDAQKWAEAFLAATDVETGCKSNAERAAFTARWFRDFADACVAEEVGRVTDRLVPRPRHDE
jgi:hypothetical protein